MNHVPAQPVHASPAGRAGSLTLVHCEDAVIVERTGRALVESGRGEVRYFPDARLVSHEVEAVDQAIDIARQAGAPVLHLSSAAALDRCRQARAAGLRVCRRRRGPRPCFGTQATLSMKSRRSAAASAGPWVIGRVLLLGPFRGDPRRRRSSRAGPSAISGQVESCLR